MKSVRTIVVITLCSIANAVEKPNYNKDWLNINEDSNTVPTTYVKDKNSERYGYRRYCPESKTDRDCFEVVELPTTSMSRPPGPYYTKNQAAYAACKALVYDHLQCGANTEASYLIVEKDNRYYFTHKAKYLGDEAKNSAPVILEFNTETRDLKERGFKIVGVAHNHPASTEGARTCFSEADKSIATGEIDIYMVSCDKGDAFNVYRYVKKDRKAYEITHAGEQIELAENRAYIYKCPPGKGTPAIDVGKGNAAYYKPVDTSRFERLAQEFIDCKKAVPARGQKTSRSEKSRNIAIDMSKLESLVEKKLALLRKALDQGKTLDNRHSLLLEINAVTKEIWVESLRLDKDFEKQTAGLSPDEKMKVCNSALAKVIPLLQETDKTLNKLIARKIIPGCETLAEWKQYIEKENAKSKAMPGNPR